MCVWTTLWIDGRQAITRGTLTVVDGDDRVRLRSDAACGNRGAVAAHRIRAATPL